MASRTEIFDLGTLGLHSGEGRTLELNVPIEPFELAGQRYTAKGGSVPVTLDVSHMTSGYALRIRYEVRLEGPCMRCLDPASPEVAVDAFEVQQPGSRDEELTSPYVDDDGELDLAAWARDALALALPAQITCRPDCAGLCPQCGANLNDEPDHGHEAEPDPRWAKLSEIRFD